MTTETTSVPYVDLNDGNRIPQLGFGVFQVPLEDTAEAVTRALEAGYRLIDTAAAYGNEAGVEDALRASGLDRGEVFITTKLRNSDHGRDRARTAFEQSLERLGGDYIDLYLIHWPIPTKDLYVETWETLCQLKDEGHLRSIGVSNFQAEHIDRIVDATGVAPTLNQIELHPRLQQPALRRYLSEHGIVTEAWSPLGQGTVLNDPVIEAIATAHQRTPAQVVLRWHIQLGNVVIPKSVTPARIAENFRVFDFDLTDERDAPAERAGSRRAHRPGPGHLRRVAVRHALRIAIVVTLLGVPAVASAGSHQVWAINCTREQYEPARIILSCGDAGIGLSKLTWSRWGRATSTGTGTYYENTCTPTCSAGHVVARPVEVTLSKPKACPGHTHPAFRRATFTFPSGAPPAAFHRFTFHCPF